VGVDYLAKKWDQAEDDLKAALTECGFVVPADEDAKPEYLEYDGDLYWLNINRRGELWINTKEKPRPVFRPVKATRVEVEAPAETGERKPETGERKQEAGDKRPEKGDRKPETADRGQEGAGPEAEGQGPNAKPQTALPAGMALLDKIRPHMRRNRRGPGGSGSTTFLSRALRTNEADLKAAFAALGLAMPNSPADKPEYTELGNEVWWLNVDSRGGLWINGREKSEGEVIAPAGESPGEAAGTAAAGESAPTATEIVAPVAGEGQPPHVPPSELATPLTEATPAAGSESGVAPVEPVAVPSFEVAPAPAVDPNLALVRPLLKETKSGAAAGNVERLAEELGKSPEELIALLVNAGLKVPEKPREKPVYVPMGSEVLWLNRNAKGELSLNVKPSKATAKDEEPEEEEGSGETGEADDAKKGARRGVRSRTKKAGETEGEG
jgi:hypothetical protein